MLKIGWASRDVSTNEPVGIMGQAYERISGGSMDPTTVTALYLEDGGDCVLFLSSDFTSIQGELLQELKTAVAKKLPEFDGGKIIWNATHTHTAPRYHLNSNYDKAPHDRVNIYPPEKYRAFLVDQASDAVVEAYRAAKPGLMSFGYGSAAVGLQRRVNYFCDKGIANKVGNTFAANGHGVMYGKTNDPDFSGFEAGTDANLYLLFTFDLEEKLTGALINVPCPSQCTEHEEFTSADYWNETRALIREAYGNIFILPQCASAGDLSPHLLHNKAARDRQNRLRYGDDPKAAQFKKPEEYYNRKDIAFKIARGFDEGYAWASREKLAEMPISHITKTVELDRWQVTQQQYEEAKANLAHLETIPFQYTDDPYADFKVNTRQSAEWSRCENVIRRFEDKAATVQSEIHILKLGQIAFATCPYELYIDYQHRIQARSPFVQTFFVQLTASSVGPGGYLCTERAAANKGYSAISYSCDVSPKGGQQLVKEILDELNRLTEGS